MDNYYRPLFPECLLLSCIYADLLLNLFVIKITNTLVTSISCQLFHLDVFNLSFNKIYFFPKHI